MDLVRREIKFQINQTLAYEIQSYLETYCDLDFHSRVEPSGHYVINSLYLDSPSMFLLEQKRSDRVRRFSMRIRSYGQRPEFPAYLEKKNRIDGFIRKTRVAIRNTDQIGILRGQVFLNEIPMSEKDRIQYSNSQFDILSLGLKPKIMTRYERKAYFGLFDNYSRVTFDRNLRFYKENDFNIFPKNHLFQNYDHEEQYNEREANIILELKCEAKVPLWMNILIQKFRLRQMQFSKFDSSWTYMTAGSDLSVYGF